MSTTAKVSARQRIESILDDNSFVEIGALVKARSTDFNIKTNDTPSDGVITGYGIVNGKLVYIYSQDASVIGGSVGEMHAKKIVNLYNMAMKTGAPVIGLVDSTGLRLQEAVDGLNAFGEIYLKQAMASGVIPMITAVFGSCGGGLSVVSSMGDFTFMEGEKAELFVNSPNAINENRKEVCDSASAKFQSESGTVDFVGTESEIFEGIRDLVSILPSNNEKADYEEECEEIGFEAPGEIKGNLVEGFSFTNEPVQFAHTAPNTKEKPKVENQKSKNNNMLPGSENRKLYNSK